ncbi:MAG TPA: polysaccharide biosynthesis/export family protein [Chthoniobacteraceae bacterium]|nr:polysaccharide biosynthesis/export family protein [Chthoniobacteraceae bacterium]
MDQQISGSRNGNRWSLWLAMAGCVGFLSACSTLPSSGPSPARIREGARTQVNPGEAPRYQLVPISRQVIDVVASRSSPGSLPDATTEAVSHRSQVITAGDTVEVTIYESGGGLFGGATSEGPGRGSGTRLPSQVVDRTGEITVPYAGRIPVRGRTPHAVEDEITARLKEKAIDPQVVVAISEHKGGDLVTVSGDARNPTQVRVTLAGTRLLDAIAECGGSTGRAEETRVTLVRGKQVRRFLLSDLFHYPSHNAMLEPGDTILLSLQPRSYLAFGATGKNGQFPFDAAGLSLAQAMARSGGLLDGRATPSAVYLYRHESARIARRLAHGQKSTADRGTTAVIYHLDLHQPEGFFLAQQFPMQDGDLIFFPNAGSVGVMKFLELINAITAPGRSGLSTAASVERL